jgi:Mrp family chromosome partitioning ATPase
MDAEVYGPNVPLMMGINRTPMAHGERIQLLKQFGVKLMSMSFMNCPHCHKRIDVFSYSGGRRTLKEIGVHFLVELPLDPGGARRRRYRQACRAASRFSRNTVARTNEEAGKSGLTFEVCE